jgi:hypothetical protein
MSEQACVAGRVHAPRCAQVRRAEIDGSREGTQEGKEEGRRDACDEDRSTILTGRLHSSVGIATYYGLDGRGF